MNKTPRKFFFDTEFHEYNARMEDGRTIRVVELISIGVIDETGRKFYAVNSEFNREAAEKNSWLKRNVLDKLPQESEWKSMAQIQGDLLSYVGGQDAEFYYWQAPHDALLLYDLLSPLRLRDNRPNFFNMRENIKGAFNIGQTFNELGN